MRHQTGFAIILTTLLFLAASAWIPLYHPFPDDDSETRIPFAAPQSKQAAQTWSSDQGHGAHEFHFCVVCALSKGMKGAFQVEPGQLLPPAGASRISTGRPAIAPRWPPLLPISRAPPA